MIVNEALKKSVLCKILYKETLEKIDTYMSNSNLDSKGKVEFVKLLEDLTDEVTNILNEE